MSIRISPWMFRIKVTPLYESRGIDFSNTFVSDELDHFKETSLYEKVRIMYFAERTETNALIAQAYGEIMSKPPSALYGPNNNDYSSIFKQRLENTEAWSLQLSMRSFDLSEDEIIKLKKFNPEFDANKTISRVKVSGERLFKNLIRLIGLASKESNAFESWRPLQGIDMNLYEALREEKESLGITHELPVIK